MHRRKFIKLTIGTCAFPLLTAKSNLSYSALNDLRVVLSTLFPNELIFVSIENDINKALKSFPVEYAPFMNFEESGINQLVTDANMICQKNYKIDFNLALLNQKQSIIDELMKNSRHLNTYRSIRDLLFSDKAYFLNKENIAWKYIGYEEHMYNKKALTSTESCH